MKGIAISLAALLAATLSVAEEHNGYTPKFVASVLADRDQRIEGKARPQRVREMERMVQRASAQCRLDVAPGKESEKVADMVMLTQKKLASEGVEVSHYELLDVLYGALGDGQPNWDCASALAMYLTVRSGEEPPALTHIAGYKVVQGMRDSGLLGAVN